MRPSDEAKRAAARGLSAARSGSPVKACQLSSIAISLWKYVGGDEEYNRTDA